MTIANKAFYGNLEPLALHIREDRSKSDVSHRAHKIYCVDQEDQIRNQPNKSDGEKCKDEDQSGNNLELRSIFERFRINQLLLASLNVGNIEIYGNQLTNQPLSSALRTSVEFSAFEKIVDSIQAASNIASIVVGSPNWKLNIRESIDLASTVNLGKQVFDTSAVDALRLHNAELLSSISEANINYQTISHQILSVLSSVDWRKVFQGIDTWLPSNLRSVDNLEFVACLSFEEGIPLAWIPRAEIVLELLNAGAPEDRQCILVERYGQIIEDCEFAISSIPHEWANECRNALTALRHTGLESPAQSHAGNIVDSIVQAVLNGKGQDIAIEKANEPLGELALRVAVDNLVLLPLHRAYVSWRAHYGVPIPANFSRHTTAHAVGNAGVFSLQQALVAVMLATSLTCQYWQHPSTPKG